MRGFADVETSWPAADGRDVVDVDRSADLLARADHVAPSTTPRVSTHHNPGLNPPKPGSQPTTTRDSTLVGADDAEGDVGIPRGEFVG